MLIVGKGSNYKFLNQIREIHSEKEVVQDYGQVSELVFSASRAFYLGQEKIYVCNVQSDSDYFEIIEQIRTLLPEYILLPGLRFDKRIKLKDGRTMPISLILSELLPSQKFILTDYHANQFKDMSHLLSHYNNLRQELSRIALYKSNISLVVNHLVDSGDASIDVACALVNTEIGDYPLLKCGDILYNLESEDFRYPIIYFKNELPVNLFNLDKDIESNLVIQRMLLAIHDEILESVSYLIGTRFTRNTIFTVKTQAENILIKRQGSYYKEYRIVDIYINNYQIIIDIDVYPFFSKNAIRTQVTVRGIQN